MTLKFNTPVIHKDEPRYIGTIEAFSGGEASVRWEFGPAYSSWHPVEQLTHDLESCRDFLNQSDATHPDGFWGPETGGDVWRLRCSMIRIDMGRARGEWRILQLMKG